MATPSPLAGEGWGEGAQSVKIGRCETVRTRFYPDKEVSCDAFRNNLIGLDSESKRESRCVNQHSYE